MKKLAILCVVFSIAGVLNITAAGQQDRKGTGELEFMFCAPRQMIRSGWWPKQVLMLLVRTMDLMRSGPDVWIIL